MTLEQKINPDKDYNKQSSSIVGAGDSSGKDRSVDFGVVEGNNSGQGGLAGKPSYTVGTKGDVNSPGRPGIESVYKNIPFNTETKDELIAAGSYNYEVTSDAIAKRNSSVNANNGNIAWCCTMIKNGATPDMLSVNSQIGAVLPPQKNKRTMFGRNIKLRVIQHPNPSGTTTEKIEGVKMERIVSIDEGSAHNITNISQVQPAFADGDDKVAENIFNSTKKTGEMIISHNGQIIGFV